MRGINRKCYSSQENGVILGVGMIILGYMEVEFELALEDRLIRWILDRFIRQIYIQDLLCNRYCARHRDNAETRECLPSQILQSSERVRH